MKKHTIYLALTLALLQGTSAKAQEPLCKKAAEAEMAKHLENEQSSQTIRYDGWEIVEPYGHVWLGEEEVRNETATAMEIHYFKITTNGLNQFQGLLLDGNCETVRSIKSELVID